MNKKIICIFCTTLLILLGISEHSSVLAAEEQYKSDNEIMAILNVFNSHYYETATKSEYSEANKNYVSKKDIDEFKASTRAGIPVKPYSTYFNSTKWITRDGKVSLSINFKPNGMYPSSLPNANAATAENAWKVLYNRHKNDSKWKNTSSMYNQFICHAATIGKRKNPWNIEPYRKDVGMSATILKGCNP